MKSRKTQAPRKRREESYRASTSDVKKQRSRRYIPHEDRISNEKSDGIHNTLIRQEHHRQTRYDKLDLTDTVDNTIRHHSKGD